MVVWWLKLRPGEVMANAHQVSSMFGIAVAVVRTLLRMQFLAQLARSFSCALSASEFVKGEHNVCVALW